MKLAACDMSVTNPGASAVPLPPPLPSLARLVCYHSSCLSPAPPSLLPSGISFLRALPGVCRLSVVPRDVTSCQRTCCTRNSSGQGVAGDDEAAPTTAGDKFRVVFYLRRLLEFFCLPFFFFFLVGEPKRGCLGGDKPTKMTREFSRWRINDPFDGPSVLRTSYRSEDNELLYWKRSRRRRRKRENRQSSNRSMNNE